MLHSFERQANRTRPASAPQTDSALHAHFHGLRQHRLLPHLFTTNRGSATAGLPLQVSVRNYLDSRIIAAGLNDTLRLALGSRTPVTLSLSGLEGAGDAFGMLQDFCVGVKDAVPEQQFAGRLLGISIRSHVLPLQAFLVITSTLGKGPRFVFLDSLQMQHHSDRRVQAATDRNWIDLWHGRRRNGAVKAVYSEAVRSGCSLLSDEKTASILPALSMPVPSESAWLPVEICLPDFSDGHGCLHIESLREALHACLDVNEGLAPLLRWSSSAQQTDSQMNNRIALLVSGIGDLLNERCLHPTEIRSLRWVERVIAAIQNELWDYSKTLARDHETLPSLLQSDPSNVWQCIEHQKVWRGRWQHTLQQEALRNRNILVLSPYSVLPRRGKVCPGFTDLLPILAHADAFSFQGAPQLDDWSVTDYSNFHRRAWAVIMRDNRRSRIAVGV